MPACYDRPSSSVAANRLRDLDDGIEFELLECLFQPGMQLFFTVKGHKTGGIVESVHYDTFCSGDAFVVQLACLESGGPSARPPSMP